jgi:hypothetical protein
MNEKLSDALARRLAAYSAAAGVTLAVAPAADGQIVYHDLDPDVVITHSDDTFWFDVDGDDRDDLIFIRTRGTLWTIDPMFGTGGVGRTSVLRIKFQAPQSLYDHNGVLGYDAPEFANPDIGGASRLSVGDAIGPLLPGQGFYPHAIAASASFAYNYYPFVGQEGYAGFRFLAGDGQLHYGWMRVAAANGAWTGTLYEYAYESRPNTPIRAGSMVALDGTVNQTTFPPEGGTLTYTFTVYNAAASPVPLDLSVKVRQGGVAVLTRLLGSGTIPAGGTVTRAVSVRVPAAASGEYRVTFQVGDFEGDVVHAAETFTITKEPSSAAIGAVTDGSNAFTVEVLPSDLFAGATAWAAAAAPATHALSAPVPNPSTGRAAFTLEVAETQAVRVEVLDALGRHVATLHDGPLAAGAAHRLTLDGSSLPTGVYAVRAVGETFSDARTLTLTR